MAKLGGRCPLNCFESETNQKEYMKNELEKYQKDFDKNSLKAEFCLKICENFLC